MAMAIKLSSPVEISDCGRDENSKSTNANDYVIIKKLPEVVHVGTSPDSVHGTCLQSDRLSSQIADVSDDVFTTHEILKKLLAKGPSQDVTSLFDMDDMVSEQTNEKINIKTEKTQSADTNCKPKSSDTNRSCCTNSCLALRLQTHKQIERRRRHELSKNLNKLQSLLYPEEKNHGKLPQLCILGSAITKVKSLKKTNKKLLAKLGELSAYHKQLCSHLAELGHPVDSLPDNRITTDIEQVPESISNNMKDVNAENAANNSGSNCCSTSPSQSCCDSFLDTDSSLQSDNIKQDSEITSNISEVTSASDRVDCDEAEGRSPSGEFSPDQTLYSNPNTLSQSQPQPATDSISSMKLGSKCNQGSPSTEGSCINHSPDSTVAKQSANKSRPVTQVSSSAKSEEKNDKVEFPSLLGKMFEDVENSLLRHSQEASGASSNKVTITDDSKKPVSLTCVPESGLVLTKCDSCGERVAFSSKVAGLVICPACSTVIIHFTPSLLHPEQAKKENPSPPKPSLATKRKKTSAPEVVINLDSDSDHEVNHQVDAPSRVTPSDVLDILKDGVRGYVDNVDGDEVIVVLK